jgi:GAF domain-containing protein
VRRAFRAGRAADRRGRRWGAINVEELERDTFDNDDVSLLSTLANQVAAAVRAALLRERLTAAEAALADARSRDGRTS